MRLVVAEITLLAVPLATFAQVGRSEGIARVKSSTVPSILLTPTHKRPLALRGASKSKSRLVRNTSSQHSKTMPQHVAFRALLPMMISMTELNGNEKYFRLSDNLPVNASIPGTIQIGDLMIYGSRTLVLFYKSFPTSYEYTRLGRINDTKGLAAAVGSGSVKVTIEQE